MTDHCLCVILLYVPYNDLNIVQHRLSSFRCIVVCIFTCIGIVNSHASCFMRDEVKFNAASSCTRAAEVNASNIVSLRVRSFNKRPSKGSRPATCDNTFDTGHIEHNFGCGGRNSKMPFIKRETKGRLPSCLPSKGSCNCKIHAL